MDSPKLVGSHLKVVCKHSQFSVLYKMELSFLAMVSQLVMYKRYLPDIVTHKVEDAGASDEPPSPRSSGSSSHSSRVSSRLFSAQSSVSDGMYSARGCTMIVWAVGLISLVRELGTAALTTLLTSYVDTVVACVKAVSGVIDCINGTRIVCHFGLTGSTTFSHEHACDSAKAILEKVGNLLNGTRLRVSIGIEHGELIVGHVGTTLRSFVQVGKCYQMAEMCTAAAHSLKCGVVAGPHLYSRLSSNKSWRMRLVDLASNMYLKTPAERMYQVVEHIVVQGDEWMYEMQALQKANDGSSGWNNAMELLFAGDYNKAASAYADLPSDALRDRFLALAQQMAKDHSGPYLRCFGISSSPSAANAPNETALDEE
eukprot:NODE_946_length_1358_cov_79.954927_g788_i0.p1 GENE.NODE_946_length_1358_cov_79.954927_g788_i0~~NODE_946_length_1358_cov_79.954927_g788_i0.p1  ORF type:complete len:370 (-),score=55.60 NODE_946_length_1358_cov_79.954927_g788_i0:135-1244(-)